MDGGELTAGEEWCEVEQWRPKPSNQHSNEEMMRKHGGAVKTWLRYAQESLQWLGWGRILTGCACVGVVGFGGYFLLRSPPRPVEISLMYASTVPLSQQIPLVTTTTIAPFLTVDVAGRVNKPGVYIVPMGSRVVDAIRIAGGSTKTADLDAINLAVPLSDGQQIYVPAVGEKVPGGQAGPIPDAHSGGQGQGLSLPVNINTADLATLDLLPGVGPATAAAIVAFRDQHGQFSSIEGLQDVPGIGPAKFAALRDMVTT